MKRDALTASSVPEDANAATGSEACRAITREAISTWKKGQIADAVGLLQQHPELRNYKSLVLDLAYEEYCLRRERGESVEISEYCRRFPEYQRSISNQLELHHLVSEHPEWLDGYSEPDWPQIGESFLGFELLELLGRGAFAQVYLARELEVGGRLVAVKVAWSGASEADLLGKASHPNIVPIHSVKHDPETGLSAICMPYLGRATLFDVLDRMGCPPKAPRDAELLYSVASSAAADVPAAPAPGGVRRRRSHVDAIVAIGASLAEALTAAHERGIYHLDLKPSNVLLTGSGAPMLLDFNLAAERNQLQQRTGGTMPYMPPEQLNSFLDRPNPTQLEPEKADVYSLGVVLYEMFSGRLPHSPDPSAPEAENAARLYRAIQAGPPTSLVRLNPWIGVRIDGLVRRCLAFLPSARPSMQELAQSLHRELSVVQRICRAATTRPLGTLAAAVAIAAGIGAVASWRRGDPPINASASGAATSPATPAAASEPAAPALPGDVIERSRAWIREGKISQAKAALEESWRSNSDPIFAELIGYCCSRERSHGRALEWYDLALGAGADTAATWNNAGLSYLQLSQTRDAIRCLDRALALNPRLVPALHNRALALLAQAEHRNESPAAALRDICAAVAEGPPTAALYLHAAQIQARTARYDSSHSSEALTSIRSAVAYGANVRSIVNDPTFIGILDETEQKNLLNIPKRNPLPALKGDRLVMPE